MINIKINLKERSYPISLEKNIFTKRNLPKGFIITDTNIFGNYTDLIEKSDNSYFIIKPGEQSKSRETYMDIIKNLPESTERIVALGGGVVGDLAGFVASTIRRGIPLIQVPTTLVAMVDASIGGKNGVNLSERKNYLGTIHQPERVLIDLAFLKTLPRNEFENGVAEIIKYGAIADYSLLERCQGEISQEDMDLEEIISKCCRIKRDFVEIDEFDKKERHSLNFGHTIGHAIELSYGLSHGRAISIGQVYESEIGRRHGIMDDATVDAIKKALEANNLPTQLPMCANIQRIIELMKQDKKGPLIFAFNEKYLDVKINEKELIEVLKK